MSDLKSPELPLNINIAMPLHSLESLSLQSLSIDLPNEIELITQQIMNYKSPTDNNMRYSDDLSFSNNPFESILPLSPCYYSSLHRISGDSQRNAANSNENDLKMDLEDSLIVTEKTFLPAYPMPASLEFSLPLKDNPMMESVLLTPAIDPLSEEWIIGDNSKDDEGSDQMSLKLDICVADEDEMKEYEDTSTMSDYPKGGSTSRAGHRSKTNHTWEETAYHLQLEVCCKEMQHYCIPNQWLNGEEYLDLLLQMESGKNPYPLYEYGYDSHHATFHPSFIYSNPCPAIYFLRCEHLKNGKPMFGFPRIKNVKKMFTWKKQGFTTVIPKSQPCVRYLTANCYLCGKGKNKNNLFAAFSGREPVLRMHAVMKLRSYTRGNMTHFLNDNYVDEGPFVLIHILKGGGHVA